MKMKETRVFKCRNLRLERRADEGGDGEDAGKPVIVGHAAVFDSWSEDLGGFREKIAPGAFTETLKDADVRALFNHNADIVIGRSKSGTLRLKEDKVGLAIEVDPPDTQAGRDLVVLMERGDIDQMSFGFRTVRDEWSHPEDNNQPSERVLMEVELFDVSPVTFPAYPDTDVAVRSLERQRNEADERREARFDQLRRHLDLAEAEVGTVS